MTSFVLDKKKQQEADEKVRRERIAVAAMQGLLAARPPGRDLDPYFIARDAIEFADSLIEELDKDDP